MTDKEIVDTVNSAFAEEFELEMESLVPEARIHEDLGLDSLDMVDMVVVLEHAFSFKLADKKSVASITTLGEVYAFISKLRDSHVIEG